MTKADNVFLVDICGTIFHSNTTMDFMRFYFGKTSWFHMVDSLLQYRIVGFLNARVFSIFHIDIIRSYCITHLRGYSSIELEQMAKKFYEVFLFKRLNPSVIRIMERRREKGEKLVLVSATLDFIAKEVAKQLDISTYFSSQLSFNNGICKGQLSVDLLDGKLEILRQNNLLGSFSGVITDNYTDVDIIKVSKTAYLIQYQNRKNKWSSIVNLNDSKYIMVVL